MGTGPKQSDDAHRAFSSWCRFDILSGSRLNTAKYAKGTVAMGSRARLPSQMLSRLAAVAAILFLLVVAPARGAALDASPAVRPTHTPAEERVVTIDTPDGRIAGTLAAPAGATLLWLQEGDDLEVELVEHSSGPKAPDKAAGAVELHRSTPLEVDVGPGGGGGPMHAAGGGTGLGVARSRASAVAFGGVGLSTKATRWVGTMGTRTA